MKKLVLSLFLLIPISGFAQSSDYLEYYDLVAGTDQFDKVKIFVVGETHTVQSDTSMQDRLITEFAPSHQSDMTYLLLEGGTLGNKSTLLPSTDFTALERFESLQAVTGGNFKLVGWDHPEAFDRVVNGYDQMQNSVNFMGDDSFWVTRMFAAINGYGWMFEKNAADGIRNHNMAEQIESTLKTSADGSKLFILCGNLHIEENVYLIPALEKLGRAYTVLRPKEGHPDRIEDMSAEDYLKTLKN